MYQGFTGYYEGSAHWTTADEFINANGHFYHPSISALGKGRLAMVWDDGSSTYKAEYSNGKWQITAVYDAMVNPNLDGGQLVAMSTSGAPYPLVFGTASDGPKWTQATSMQYSRRIVAAKVPKYSRKQRSTDTTGYFSVGLSGLRLRMSDGSVMPLHFAAVNDTAPQLSEENAWEKLGSETFTLTASVDSILMNGVGQTARPEKIMGEEHGVRLAFDLVDPQNGHTIQRLANERFFEQDTIQAFNIRARLTRLVGREVMLMPKVLGIAKGRKDIAYTLVHVHTVMADSTGNSTRISLAKNGGHGAQLLPTEFALHQNYPNPFNPSTQFNFDLPGAANVSLVVYDLLGKKVVELARGSYEVGYHSVVWDASR
jgi:hypothetical protein